MLSQVHDIYVSKIIIIQSSNIYQNMHKGVITTNDSQYDEIIEYESDRKPQRDIIEDEKKTIELYYQRQVKVSKYL